MHLAFTTLLDIVAKNGGQLPRLNSAEDAEELLAAVKEVNSQRKTIDEEGVLKVEEIEE